MPQTEELQESFCRAIQQRASQIVGTADDANEIAIHQLPQDVAALHSANRLDFGPQYRPTIRHNSQGFHRRSGNPHFDRRLEQSPQPRTEHRTGQHLKTAGQLFDAESAPIAVIQLIQPANQCTGFGAVRQASQLSDSPARQRLAGEEQHGLDAGQAPFARRRASGRLKFVALSRPETPRLHKADAAPRRLKLNRGACSDTGDRSSSCRGVSNLHGDCERVN